MIILDTLLIGGLRFIFSRIAEAVDAEMNDDTVLREELLAAQMRLELGELTEAQFVEIERELLRRLREIRERTQAGEPAGGDVRIASIDTALPDDAGREDGGAGPRGR